MRGATMILFLRNIFFVIILPGSVTVTIPYYFILRRHIVIERFGLAQVGGLIEMTFGSYILFVVCGISPRTAVVLSRRWIRRGPWLC